MAQPTTEEVKTLFAVHYGPAASAERAARAAALDSTRTWVDPNGYRLSDRIWLQRANIRKSIDKELRKAIASGEDALIVARKLEQYLNPELRPLRLPDKNGRMRLVPGQPKRIVTDRPGRGGSGSYSARRLARTEITRAHGQATELAINSNPFSIGTKWSLSSSHPEIDHCDINAQHDEGLGTGVFPRGSLPKYPDHPHCLCVLSSARVTDKAERAKIIDQLREDAGLNLDMQPVQEATRKGQEILTRPDNPSPVPIVGAGDLIGETIHSTRAALDFLRKAPATVEHFEDMYFGTYARGRFDNEAIFSYDDWRVTANYTGGSYRPYNGLARGDTSMIDEFYDYEVPEEQLQRLDRVLRHPEEAILPEDTALFRYESYADGIPDRIMDLKAGDSVTEWGYTSTSVSRDYVAGKGNVRFQIYAPQGSRGMYVREIGFADESEFLLPRGTSFYIHQIEETVEQGRTIRTIRMEIIQETEATAEAVVERTTRELLDEANVNLFDYRTWYGDTPFGSTAIEDMVLKLIPEINQGRMTAAEAFEQVIEAGAPEPNWLTLMRNADPNRPAWRPQMSPAEAEQWIKDSGGVYNEAIFHFTKERAYDEIMKDQMRPGAGVWDGAVYTTTDRNPLNTGRYSSDRVFEIRTRVRNPKELTFDDYYDIVKQEGSESAANRFLTSQGYDGILVKFRGSDPDWMLVFDPQDVTIIRHGKFDEITDSMDLTDVAGTTAKQAIEIQPDDIPRLPGLNDAEHRAAQNVSQGYADGTLSADDFYDWMSSELPTMTEDMLDWYNPFEDVARQELTWKPSMSRDDAVKWARQGDMENRALYHISSPEAVTGIGETGFDLTKSQWGRVWGNGAYMSDIVESADFYAQAFRVPARIELRVFSRKTLRVDVTGMSDTGSTAILRSLPADELRDANNLFRDHVEYFNLRKQKIQDESIKLPPTERAAWIRKTINEEGLNGYSADAYALTSTLQDLGYDAIDLVDAEFRTQVGGSQVIVFDPKRVVVIEDSAEPLYKIDATRWERFRAGDTSYDDYD